MNKNNQQKKIFVCEDDEGISGLIKTVLEENDYMVKIANNGKGVFRKVKQMCPNLVLVDIWMPGIKGEDVVKILKSNVETQEIPIVIISALNDIKKIAKETKADAYIAKPFDINDFLAVVKKYTD